VAVTKVGSDAFLGFYTDLQMRESLDAIARENGRSRSAELRRATTEYVRRQALRQRQELAFLRAANKWSRAT
jgi:predicted transcriptional regulator